MLRPTIVYTTTHRQAATLVLLADRSRSMQVADAFGNKTRWQELTTILGDAVPMLADLAEEEIEVKLYILDVRCAIRSISRLAGSSSVRCPMARKPPSDMPCRRSAPARGGQAPGRRRTAVRRNAAGLQRSATFHTTADAGQCLI